MSNNKRKLFILLNGKSKEIFQAHKLKEDGYEFVKIDEKDLSKPRFIFKLIKKSNYEEVSFGTYDLRFQRFFFFMKFYILFSGVMKGSIFDQQGKKLKVGVLSFLFIDYPKFVIEIIYSVLIVIRYKLKF